VVHPGCRPSPAARPPGPARRRLRIGELAGLRRRRVDLLRGTVDVVEVRGELYMGPPKTRAGRTHLGGFTLDRYGHLFPGHDQELRDRLDAMHAQGLLAVSGGSVVELPGGPARARHGPSAAHGEASKQEDPAQDRA
jgi:hypothetical protein